MTREVKVNGIYKHFKGHIYKVLALGKDAETEEEKVVYQNILSEKDIWIRDKNEFLSEVDHQKYPDVTQKYRFELKEDK